MMDCDMMGGGMMGGAMMLLWLVFALVLLALAVTALIWLVRQIRGSSGPADAPAKRRSAREELDRRYAIGELGREDTCRRGSWRTERNRENPYSEGTPSIALARS